MTVLGLFVALLGGLPLLYGLVLLVRKRRRQGRAARAQNEHSVFAIATRIAREHERDEPPFRWPRVDSDRGVIRDNRASEPLPLAGRQPGLRQDDTVPLVVRSTTELSFSLSAQPFERNA